MFFELCGVAVGPTGVVYVGDHLGAVWRYAPTGAAPLTDSDYTVSAAVFGEFHPCAVAVDSVGNVYAAERGESPAPENGPVRKIQDAEFAVPYGLTPGTPVAASATAIAVEPGTDRLYVNDGTQITEYTAGGASQVEATAWGS